jgi:GNAT superfamily N-acetyltransferase
VESNTPDEEAAVEVRRARPEELPAIVTALGQEPFFTDRLDRQRRGLGGLLAAWVGDLPVGDVYLWCEPADQPVLREKLSDVPVLQHLEVLAQWQRRGIGSALLDAAERLAFENGHGFVCLGVGVTNPARALYERRGYEDWDQGVVEFTWEEPRPDATPVTISETCHVLLKSVDPSIPGLDRWAAWHPREAAARLAGCPVPWCVAAGWAIDLHLGRQTRRHSDLEIAIPRAQFAALRPYLAGFDLYRAGNRRLRRLGPAESPDAGDYQIWVCEAAVPAWRMDTFLEPGDTETWVSHRDARVRVALRDATARTSDGIPFLRPEIVLFTKAKHARDKDNADLAAALPTLDDRARAWLFDTIALVHPGHCWLDQIG